MTEYHTAALLRFLRDQNGDHFENSLLLLKQEMSDLRMLPIGGHPETAWDDQGRPTANEVWNNRSHINAVGDPMISLNERFKNARDALVDYFVKTGLFPADITKQDADLRIAEMQAALEKKSKNNYAFATLLATEERATGVRTASVIDGGTGIRGEAFGSTICGRGSIAKLSTDYMVGNLGYGASTSLRHCHGAVIASIHYKEPGVIYWTVVHRISGVLPGERPSWVWYCDENGHALKALRSEIDPSLIITPDSLNSKNINEVREAERTGRIFLPHGHGTNVRMIGFPLPAWSQLYYKTREIGFGVAAQHAMINGMYHQQKRGIQETTDDLEENKHDLRYSKGMRFILNGDRERNLYPRRHHQPMVALDVDGLGTVSLEAWIDDSNVKTGKPPITALGLDPVQITLHGGKHAGLSLKRLLDDVKMSYLDQHVLIEIRLDSLSDTQLDNVLKSDREALVPEHAKKIEAAIKTFVRNDGHFIVANKYYRSLVVEGQVADAVRADLRQFDHLLHNIAGSVFSLAGPTGTGFTKVRRNINGEHEAISKSYGGKSEPREPRVIVERDPPTYLTVRKATIKVGHREYFHIETDAPAHYHDSISLECPVGLRWESMNEAMTFLKDIPASRKGLQGGRDGFLVECHPNVSPVDSRGNPTTEMVRAVLIKGSLNLSSAPIMIEVVEPTEPKKVKLVQGGGPSMPNIDVFLTKPGAANWANGMKPPDNMDPTTVACTYRHEADRVDCYVNEEFADYQRMLDNLNQEFAPKLTDKLFGLDILRLAAKTTVMNCIHNSMVQDLEGAVEIKRIVEDDAVFHRTMAANLGNAMMQRYLAILAAK